MKSDYQNWFPGLHARYSLTPGLLARASYSEGIGRPPFGNIIPNTTVNDSAQSITVTNPNLKPQYARNWDFSSEYYFTPQGMISAPKVGNMTIYNGPNGEYLGYHIEGGNDD